MLGVLLLAAQRLAVFAGAANRTWTVYAAIAICSTSVVALGIVIAARLVRLSDVSIARIALSLAAAIGVLGLLSPVINAATAAYSAGTALWSTGALLLWNRSPRLSLSLAGSLTVVSFLLLGQISWLSALAGTTASETIRAVQAQAIFPVSIIAGAAGVAAWARARGLSRT